MAPGTGMTWAIAKANDIQANHKLSSQNRPGAVNA